MFCRKMIAFAGITVLLVLCSVFFNAEVSSQELRTPPFTLKASEILPQGLIRGENYTVKETVSNDGLINTYELETKYGPTTVESTVSLLKRINELKALDAMEKMQGTDTFVKAAQDAATGPLATARDLVVNPVGTVKNIGSGISRFFSNVGQAISSNSPDQPNIAKAALGQAVNKRGFAYEFKVDPYSSYKPLQDTLDKIAWTATAGSLTVKAAFSAIPGGAGTVVSLTSTSDSLRSLVRDNTPAALEQINRDKLSGMGIPDRVINAYMNNRHYNAFEQTILVGELDDMRGIKGRDAFIYVASMANEETVAIYMRGTAQLMALFNKRVAPVDHMVEISRLVFLKTKNGRMVGIFPVDNVSWTANLLQRERDISQAMRKMRGVRGKELWFGGPVDRAAREALEARGWKVVDRFLERAFKELVKQ